VFANLIDDGKGIRDTSSGDAVLLLSDVAASAVWNIRCAVWDGGVQTLDSYSANSNIVYYFTAERDDSADTWDIDIYADPDRTSLAVSLSVPIADKYDFRYFYAVQSFNSGNSNLFTGYMEDFVIATVLGNGGSNLLMMGI
jgi:hypothetical protein